MKRLFRVRSFQPDPEGDIREEIQAHLDLKAEELMARGLSEEEARDEARRRFGNLEQVRAASERYATARERKNRVGDRIATVAQDLRYATRTLLRAPGMTLLTILILALGIGANTAIFSVLKSVALEPLPLPEPDELVFVWNRNIHSSGRGPASFPDFLDWRAQNQTFGAMGAFGGGYLNLTDGDEPVRIRAAHVTASVFDVLDVQPVIGRTLRPEEDLSGLPVVVLSHELWVERYGGDPDLLQRTVSINGDAYDVVGVMPEGFVHPTPWGMGEPFLAWVPLQDDAWVRNRTSYSYQILGRLRSGVHVQTAQQDLDQVGIRLEEAYPEANEGNRAWVVPLHRLLFGGAGEQIVIVLLAAGAVLLIACGNIAGFQLARAATRQTEIAIRASLGASRGRVVRQLLTESTLLALAGGGAALLLAHWSTDLLRTLVPPTLPRTEAIRVDSGVLLFAMILSILTGLVFGLTPALAASRARLVEALKEGRRTEKRKAWFRGQNAFVISQFALSLALANAGFLLIRSYATLREMDQGFDQDHTLTMAVSLGGERYAERDVRPPFYDELIPRLQALPGVRAAGAVSKLPLEGGTNGPVVTEGRLAEMQGQDGILMERSGVEGDYFRAMGIPLLAGRLLTAQDRDPANPRVVINETAALRLWPDEDPIGKRFSHGGDPLLWETVVGVVGDVRQWGVEVRPRPESYSWYGRDPDPRMYLTIRAEGDPSALVRLVREEVLRADPNLPVSEIRTMGDIVSSQMAGREFYTLLIGFFSILALALAAAGIYGIISCFVIQRTPELGIRLALGASRNGLLTHVIRRAVSIVAAGLAVGIGLILLTTPLVSGFLFGVRPLDTPTILGGLLLLLATGIAAALFPGFRATRLSPVAALRTE